MSANLQPGDRERAERTAIHALARGRTRQEASDLAQISRRTLQSWLQDEGFRSRVEIEQERLAEAEPEAIRILRDALHARRDDGIDWQARIRAAIQLLEAVPDEQPTGSGVTVVEVSIPWERFTPEMVEATCLAIARRNRLAQRAGE